MMTLELYEKASDIRIQINHLYDILGVLKNSKGKFLCAMSIDKEIVINDVHIMDEPILGKMIDVVEGEIRWLEEEFRRL